MPTTIHFGKEDQLIVTESAEEVGEALVAARKDGTVLSLHQQRPRGPEPVYVVPDKVLWFRKRNR